MKRTWQGHGRVELKTEDVWERLEFKARAEVGFISRGFHFRHIKTYVNVMLPEPHAPGFYAEGYPHTHEPPDALTLIHYLEPGDGSALLDLFDDQGCYIRSIAPARGLTVFLPNSQSHGVRRNTGTLTRYALIATALPEPRRR